MTDTVSPTAILADDEPFMRAALREQLKQLWPELHILQECDDGPAAVRAAKQLKPNLAFLDIRMPGLTGLQAAQAMDPAIRIVFVTAHDQHALEAFEANAVDYVQSFRETLRGRSSIARCSQSCRRPNRWRSDCPGCRYRWEVRSALFTSTTLCSSSLTTSTRASSPAIAMASSGSLLRTCWSRWTERSLSRFIEAR
jgi:DNA-binding LytR/AlgR family response regulator